MNMLARTANLRRAQPVEPNYSGLTFRQTVVDGTSSTSNAYPGVNIGSANANRKVIVAFSTGNLPNVTSLTVNGVAATQLGGFGYFFIASVPTGTTCDLAWTYSGNPAGTIIGVWTVNMTDPSHYALGMFANAETVNGVDIPANGFALIVSQNGVTSDTTVSWNQSFVNDFEDFNPIQTWNAAFAHREVTAAFTGSVTADWVVSGAMVYNSWVSFAGVAPPVVTYDADTDAWEAAVIGLGASVTTGRKGLVDALIVGLKTDGVWTKCDRILSYAADNPSSGLTCFKSRVSCAVSGSPVFTPNVGYTSNGGSGYIDTNFNFSSSAVNYTQNAAHLSQWNVDTMANPNPTMRTSIGDQQQYIIPQAYFDGLTYMQVNDSPSSPGYNVITPAGTTIGFHLGNRSSSTARQSYHNGIRRDSYGSISSTTLPNGTWTTWTQQIACVTMGGSLNATEQLALYNRLYTFLHAINPSVFT